MFDPSGEYISIREFIEIVPVSRPTAYKMIALKQVKGIRAGQKKWMIRRDSIGQASANVQALADEPQRAA